MQYKKINRLNFVMLIGLSMIVLSITAYCFVRETKGVPERVETMIKDTPIDQLIINASLRDSLVGFGMKFLGTPYVAGGFSKYGFDCSGFVYFVFQHFKIQVPRSSSQFKNYGKEIPIDSVRKGDILVFLSPTRNVIGHVGIVTNPKGKESEFIHASSSSEMSVIISSLKEKGYKHRFVKAVNVF